MKVYKVKEVTGGVSYIETDSESVAAILDESSPGASFTVTVVNMSESEINALPEFEGF